MENLVKTWEMEASHKKELSQWTTIDHNDYKVQVNGGKVFEGSFVKEVGNYNALLAECPAYKKCKALNSFQVKVGAT